MITKSLKLFWVHDHLVLSMIKMQVYQVHRKWRTEKNAIEKISSTSLYSRLIFSSRFQNAVQHLTGTHVVGKCSSIKSLCLKDFSSKVWGGKLRMKSEARIWIWYRTEYWWSLNDLYFSGFLKIHSPYPKKLLSYYLINIFVNILILTAILR